MDKKQLERVANRLRILTVEAIYQAQSGHPGGSLSICDILSVLFFEHMRVDAKNPQNPDRDRFVLSKGHAAPAYYAALSQKGFFSEKEMGGLRQMGSFLQGHPCRNKVPGVDMSSGSLGQGLSAANGMAMVGKMDSRKYRVYCLCGDGEMQEGQIWEAAMTSAHYELDNLTLLVDCNGLQIDGAVCAVMNNSPLSEKLSSFGWYTIEANGHDVISLDRALRMAKEKKGCPTAILCNTVKGKGISYMENKAEWHGKAPNDEQYRRAMDELGADQEVTRWENI